MTPWCGGCYVRDLALTQMSMPQHRIGPGGGMLEQLGCFVRSTSYRSTCTVVPLAKGPGQALRPDSPHFCRVWQGPWRGRRVLEHADRAVYAINGALMGSYGAVPVDAVLQVMKLACARSSCRWKRERIFHRPFEELVPAAAAILIRKKKKKTRSQLSRGWRCQNATWRQDIAPTWIGNGS